MNTRLKSSILLFVPLACCIIFIMTMNTHLFKASSIQNVEEVFESTVSPNPIEYPITFVSAFIDIGPVQKHGGFVRNKSTYLQWMTEYGRLNAPLVFYSNDQQFVNEVTTIRRKFEGITKVIYLNDVRSLTGYKHFDEINKLFATPEYPKVRGVTTNAEYCCVMHSKYDLIEMSIKKDYFRTSYIAWADIGYLRNMGGSNRTLEVTLPPQFNDSRIAFNMVEKLNHRARITTVMKKLSLWVGGGFFLGKPSILLEFIKQYRQFVDKMISLNLMSTDENIIYAMYTNEGYTKERVGIQLYYGPEDKCDYWFHIMYLMTNHSCLGKRTLVMEEQFPE